MRVHEKWIALILLAALLGIRAGAEELTYTPEQLAEIRAIASKHMGKKMAAMSREDDAALGKAVPIVSTDKDSLALNGFGIPGGRFGNSDALQCEQGLLTVSNSTYFNQRYLRFAFDPTRTFAVVIKEQIDDMAPYLAMKSMTPALRQNLQSQLDILNRVHSQSELQVHQTLQMYGQRLTGNNAMTPAQSSALAALMEHRQVMIEDLQKLAAAHQKSPHDAALEAKLFAKYDEYSKSTRSSLLTNKEFWSPGQRRALGLDPDPNAKPRQHTVVSSSASASSSASSGGDEEIADAAARASKYEAEEKARQKRHRDEAKIKFALKGTDALTLSVSVDCPNGTLWLYADALPDNSGASYTVYLDESDTWAKQKEDWKKNYDLSKPDQAAAAQRLETATSKAFFSWSQPVEELRKKTQSVPDDVQQRLTAMIKELDAAAAAAQQLYQQTLAKPADAALQRQLFEAVRTACIIDRKNSALTMRSAYDEEGVRDDLPWLLNLDQSDVAASGQLSTASEMSGGSRGSISVSARPAGDKQYVGINASSATVGSLADEVEHAARKYFHNHKLKLTVDAAASDKPLKGIVEGKSPEELFKSFAQRAGVNMVKDEKNPDAYVLKL